jgi:hypothetical protein
MVAQYAPDRNRNTMPRPCPLGQPQGRPQGSPLFTLTSAALSRACFHARMASIS